MCFFNCLLVCWCFVCVGTSLFYHCGLLLVHLFILVCVWENEMGSMADWPDALQEALWNIRGLRGRARRGPDWLESLTHSLQHTDSVTPQITTTPSQPQPHNLDPCTASTPNTHTLMFGIISDVMVTSFLFAALNGHGGLSVSLRQENRQWQTQSSVGIDSWVCEFFLHRVLPSVHVSIFLLHIRREEEVEQTSVSYSPSKCISTASTS